MTSSESSTNDEVDPTWRRASTVRIEDAFCLRTPEAYDYGIMDDRVTRGWWTHLRRVLAPELPPSLAKARYTPSELDGTHRSARVLREAVRGAHARKANACRSALLSWLPDEERRQKAYLERPWPRVRVSTFRARADFDPLSEERLADARRCHQCFGRKLHPAYRALVAYACLLIALGEPVPDDIATNLADYLVEEITCLPLAEEFSGYGSWTFRSDFPGVFGAHVDPRKRHPRTDAFDHSSRTALHSGKPRNMASPFLWRNAFGRDLDGFLLTPLGRDWVPAFVSPPVNRPRWA